MAGDEGSPGRCEEEDGLRDLFGPSAAPRRGRVDRPLPHIGRELVGHRRRGEPRRNAVYPHSKGGELEGGRAGKRNYAGFRRRDAKAAAKEIRRVTGGGADAAFEVIGNPEVLDLATQVVKWGGRVIVVGYSEKPALLQSGRIMFRELEVKGSLGCGLQDFPRVIDLVAQGKVKLDRMVTHRFALDEINKGFRMLDAGAEGLVRAIALP